MKIIAIKKIKNATIVPIFMVDLLINVATITVNTNPELAKGVAKLNLLAYNDDVKKYKPKKPTMQSETMAIKSSVETSMLTFTN
jgi:hypothetical protein